MSFLSKLRKFEKIPPGFRKSVQKLSKKTKKGEAEKQEWNSPETSCEKPDKALDFRRQGKDKGRQE